MKAFKTNVIFKPRSPDDKDNGEDQCFCGKSVDVPLADVLKDIGSTFDQWKPAQQRSACKQLVTFSGQANKAWDIKELMQYGVKSRIGCNRKVTFQGHCFFGGAVNYAMWGLIMHKCHKVFWLHADYSHTAMISAIIYHKWDIGDNILTNEEAQQALFFGDYGWYNDGRSVLTLENSCAPDFSQDDRTFHWIWRPVKNNP